MRALVAALSCLLLCAACATDVDYSMIRSPGGLTSQRIANLQRGTMTQAFRLGIAPPIRGMGAYRADERHSWSKEERVVIDRWVEAAKQKGVIKDAVYLPRFLVDSTKGGADPLRESARAAQLAGADAVLVVQSASGTNTGGNLLSVLYLTIVGAWFVPGTTLRSSAIAEGVLLGADGTTLYAFGEGLGKRSTIQPQVYVDEAGAENRTTCDALDELGKRMLEMARQ